MEKKKVVLIATKNLSLPGGVANFYRVIKNKYNKKDIQIEFFYQGINKSHDEILKSEYLLKYIKDLKCFIKFLKNNKDIKLVHLNPSFIRIPIIRDSIYMIFAKFFKKKVITFFHGWDNNFEKKLMNSNIKKKLFSNIYNRSDLFYVLSEDFKSSLKKIGLTKKINVIKTTFDGDKYQSLGKKDGLFKMVYVGRLQREKGIFIILKALNELKLANMSFKMSFIGWFVNKEIQEEFNNMVELFNLRDSIDVKGFVSDNEKILTLIDSDIFVFPTFYSEGCPTVVIEALAASLFVITTDTAALKEVIKDRINGLIVKKDDYKDLESNLKWCFDNREKVNELGKKNRKYAFDNFESGKIIEDFYREYKNLVNGGK